MTLNKNEFFRSFFLVAERKEGYYSTNFTEIWAQESLCSRLLPHHQVNSLQEKHVDLKVVISNFHLFVNDAITDIFFTDEACNWANLYCSDKNQLHTPTSIDRNLSQSSVRGQRWLAYSLHYRSWLGKHPIFDQCQHIRVYEQLERATSFSPCRRITDC